MCNAQNVERKSYWNFYRVHACCNLIRSQVELAGIICITSNQCTLQGMRSNRDLAGLSMGKIDSSAAGNLAMRNPLRRSPLHRRSSRKTPRRRPTRKWRRDHATTIPRARTATLGHRPAQSNPVHRGHRP